MQTKRFGYVASALFVALLVGAPVALPAAGGPDAFGYTFTDSNDVGGPLPLYVPLSVAGTTVLGTRHILTDDSVTPLLNVGFPFDFYGTSYTQFRISSNGFLIFGASTSNGCCTGGLLPSLAQPNGVVAGFWEDLHPGIGGAIASVTLGVPGSQVLIAEWSDVPHFGNPAIRATFEIILFEGSNDIEVHYLTTATDGGIHTSGIENAAGTVGLIYQRSNTFAPSLTAVRFDHP